MSTHISTTNAYGWKPRQTEQVTCPSGVKVSVRRPGPEFALRAGRVAKTFSQAIKKEKRDEQTEEEFGQDVLARMSDEELGAVLIFACELVCAMTVSPKLSRKPNAALGEIGPEDVPDEDFWFLFNYAMTGFYGLKVPVGDKEEVEVSDLETFPEESGIQGSGLDSASVQSDTEQPVADQGLGHSA
jgi:hypothetical protein